MSSRFNNKRLLFILLGLFVILILTVVIKLPKENSTLRSKIVEFDTSGVNRIIFYPKQNSGKAIEFSKNKNRWEVQSGKIVSATREGAVQNIFNEVLNLKPKSLAALSKSKWQEFDLTDSLATRIQFLDKNGKTLADLMIGKFTYKPQESPYSGYGGNNMSITSYVRLHSDIKVYTIDNFLSFSFSQRFDDWRDNTFIKLEKDNITNISFIYPADSSFNLVKNGKTWLIGKQTADSAAVAGFLTSLGPLNGETFKDNYIPDVSPAYQLKIEGNNLLNISVRCFKDSGKDEFIVNSTLNPEVYFTTSKQGIFGKIYKPRSYFLKQGK